MAMTVLRRLASLSAAPIYPALGDGGAERTASLANDNRLRIVPSVRHASILLVAGAVRDADLADLRRLHDQLPHPRRTVWWGTNPFAGMRDPICLSEHDDAGAILVETWRRFLAGRTSSEPDLLPNEPANEWRGKGDYGQGGEGMMGGTPYGRPMAMTGDDIRDGLALDAFTSEFGPFLNIFPPGLKLELTLQGDVIQSAKVRRPPYAAKTDTDMASQVQGRLLHLTGGSKRRSARAAIPASLGRIGRTDVRSRFDGRMAEAMTGETPRLVEMLRGLEWNEAVLLINSFPSSILAAMCPLDEEADENGGDKHGPHSMDHGEHG